MFLKTQSFLYLLAAFACLWNIMIFAYQWRLFPNRKSTENLYSLIFLVLGFLLMGGLSLSFLYSEIIGEMLQVYMIELAFTLTFIFIVFLDSSLMKNSHTLRRLLLYSAAFLSAHLIGNLLTNGDPLVITQVLVFSLFLITEIMVINLSELEKSVSSHRLKLVTFGYILVFLGNLGGLLIDNLPHLLGVIFFPFLLSFYYIYQYRDARESLQDEIILLNQIRKREKSCYTSSVHLIVSLLESISPFIKGHAANVSFYSTILGMHYGLSSGELEELNTAALLHDIGFIGTLDELSNRKIMNPKDFQKIRRHPEIGAEILSRSEIFSRYRDIVLYHHEDWNGGGYPAGLKGEQIPLYSRIIRIADTFDSLTSNRFYRTALTKEEAMIIILAGSGNEFDPRLVKLFRTCFNQGGA